jgi:apolipoprotein N-acyltransferase
VRATILGPWLVSSLLLACSHLPYLSINECLRYGVMALLVGPLALGCLQESFSQKKWTPSPTRVAWGLLGLALLALVAWRLALAGGVRL